MNDQNPNQTTAAPSGQDQNQKNSTASQPVSSGINKEREMPKTTDEPLIEVREHEIPKEIQGHVVKTKEHIEIPPDLRKMGVAAPPVASSVSDVAVKSVKLPLTDDQIEEGLHTQILSSFRWLAEWCLRQLRKAHIHLKKIGAHFVREKD